MLRRPIPTQDRRDQCVTTNPSQPVATALVGTYAAFRGFQPRDRASGSSEMRTFVPVALAIRSRVDKVGFDAPLSRRAMVDCDVPMRAASSCCERCALVRAQLRLRTSHGITDAIASSGIWVNSQGTTGVAVSVDPRVAHVIVRLLGTRSSLPRRRRCSTFIAVQTETPDEAVT